MTLATDLSAVVAGATQPPQSRLPSAQEVAAIPLKKGVSATAIAVDMLSGLTELDYTAREWHPTVTLNSSSGLFSLQYRRPKTIFLTLSSGAVLPLKLATP